jgi:hypothetical protein
MQTVRHPFLHAGMFCDIVFTKQSFLSLCTQLVWRGKQRDSLQGLTTQIHFRLVVPSRRFQTVGGPNLCRLPVPNHWQIGMVDLTRSFFLIGERFFHQIHITTQGELLFVYMVECIVFDLASKSSLPDKQIKAVSKVGIG